MKTSIKNKLKSIYYDLSSPGSFGGIMRLYREAKTHGVKVRIKDVREWLSSQDTYSLFRPVVRKFKRNPIYSKGPLHLWTSDLLDVGNLSQHNDDTRFLLVTLDVFTKRTHIVPIKAKDAISVSNAFKTIFDVEKPKLLYTDAGGEYVNRKCQEVFAQYGVKHYTSKDDATKAATSERQFRDIRLRLERFMHANKTLRYLEALPSLKHNYEHSFHRAIKMRPVDVTTGNAKIVHKNLYGRGLKVGDPVRLARKKGPFEKEVDKNWTQEIYYVKNIKKNQKIPMYHLRDYDGNSIAGGVYKQELQVVQEPEVYKVEKVLRTRKRAGRTEYFVKWLGYPNSSNSWVTDLI